MRIATIGFASAILFGAAPVSAMSVADFLAKADALKAKGPMALFSSDLTLLKTEAADGFKAWHAQAAPPGRPPNACPPAEKRQSTADEVLAMLREVPPEQRTTTSTADALIAGLNRRFPCRG